MSLAVSRLLCRFSWNRAVATGYLTHTGGYASIYTWVLGLKSPFPSLYLLNLSMIRLIVVEHTLSHVLHNLFLPPLLDDVIKFSSFLNPSSPTTFDRIFELIYKPLSHSITEEMYLILAR